MGERTCRVETAVWPRRRARPNGQVKIAEVRAGGGVMMPRHGNPLSDRRSGSEPMGRWAREQRLNGEIEMNDSETNDDLTACGELAAAFCELLTLAHPGPDHTAVRARTAMHYREIVGSTLPVATPHHVMNLLEVARAQLAGLGRWPTEAELEATLSSLLERYGDSREHLPPMEDLSLAVTAVHRWIWQHRAWPAWLGPYEPIVVSACQQLGLEADDLRQLGYRPAQADRAGVHLRAVQ